MLYIHFRSWSLVPFFELHPIALHVTYVVWRIYCLKNPYCIDILSLSISPQVSQLILSLVDPHPPISIEDILIALTCSACPDSIALINDSLNKSVPSALQTRAKVYPVIVAEEACKAHELGLGPRSQLLGVCAPQQSILKMGSIEFQGVDLTSEAGQIAAVDWRYVNM